MILGVERGGGHLSLGTITGERGSGGVMGGHLSLGKMNLCSNCRTRGGGEGGGGGDGESFVSF